MTSIEELLNEYEFTHIGDVDKNGNTVFHLTMDNGRLTEKKIIEISEILLNSRLDPEIKNKNNETPLQLAMKNRMKDVINFLVPYLTDFNSATQYFINNEYKQFRDFFDEFLAKDSANFLEFLISLKRFDFYYKNEQNESAVLMAINFNLEHILPVLLKHTKYINFVDKNNRTLLHLFFEKKNSENLQHYGIGKNWYSRRYNIEIMKILLNRGISVDAEDKSKRTPIQLAIEKKVDLDIIEMLLERSTNVDRKNSKGHTMLHTLICKPLNCGLAEDNYYAKILRLLLARRGFNVEQSYDIGKSKNFRLAPNDLPNFATHMYAYRNELQILLKHWIKLTVANTTCSNLTCNTAKEYNELIAKKEYKFYYDRCRREIETLKNTFIDSSTSLYNFIHTNRRCSRAYLNNEKLKKIVTCSTLSEQFPEYAALIIVCYQEAVTRQTLLEPAKKAWLGFTEIYLPELCLEYIYSFVSNSDLFSIIGQT